MKSFVIKYKEIMRKMNRILSVLAGILLLILTVLLIINIIFREIGFPISGLISISILLMIIVAYLGLAETEEQGAHANIDILANILPSKFEKYNFLIINIINFLTIMTFFIISVPEARSSYLVGEAFTDVVNIEIWPAKLAISIGLGFYLLQILLKIMESFVAEND